MAELVIRILAAAGSLALGALLPKVGLVFAGQAASLFAAWSVLIFLLERRGYRGAGVSAVIAIVDSAWIAAMLAVSGRTETAGFMVLAPGLWAAVRHGSNPAHMAPPAAAMNLAALNVFGGNPLSPMILIQAAGISLLGLMAAAGRQTVTVTKIEEVIKETPVELPSDYLEFRENFRALRDHANQLERKSRRDRLGMTLIQAVQTSVENPYSSLAKKLMELCGAEGLTLYTFSSFGQRMVVQSVSGEVPAKLHSTSFEAPASLGEGQIRHKVEKLLPTLRGEGSSVQFGSVILKCRGKIVGMVNLFHGRVDASDEATQKTEEVADILGQLLRAQMDREEEIRRLKEAEMLYAVACTTAGSDTQAGLANRVVRELWDMMELDHLSVNFLDGSVPILLAQKGLELDALNLMSFGFGPGIVGWQKSGAPDLILSDAKGDMRLESIEAVKRRIGCLVILPIELNGQVSGYLSAMTNRMHAIDEGQIETLRVIVSEMGQAMGRLESGRDGSEGLATPKELFAAVNQAESGSLVYLEVVKHDDLVEKFGRAAVLHAIGKLARRMRAKLPPGGLLCRRDEGDYVAFLRDFDDRQAGSWANEAIINASLIGLTTPDGRAKIPLALKAKTAELDRKVQDILEEAKPAVATV